MYAHVCICMHMSAHVCMYVGGGGAFDQVARVRRYGSPFGASSVGPAGAPLLCPSTSTVMQLDQNLACCPRITHKVGW